ncbi:glycosyltransferase family 2 protein [Komarekiella sp. 'clone 1']|uniref:Glycosyltransferase family 2 protein n=1 Tax=Komarekiella delphini-convector SJRDD-AB1 TaxID=2593771 RepID=A0AA40STC4_9NOST|nr:glycosyltransferase family 2 protein [Komarekiella delphini-convector]MBD6614623.1 glycosyltransferase family 2 protein [Komarekiella delphini-convector SJRDD-AB1]
MKDLTIFLSKSLLSWLAIQVFFTLVFIWYLRLSQKNLLPDDQLPKTAVILCLRGADPFLPNCLRSLLNQNYPNYDLKLIVDSHEDPAWKIASNTITEQEASNVQISPLRIVRNNCSLKCSSLVQAVRELDDSYKVVALVDADTIVHPNWLRELVSPLADAKVGATTGNRWYVPTGKHWGSLVRYIGNVSTVVQMFLFQIPWGGTLAVKTEVLRQTGLLDKWAQALGEDLMIHKALKKQGLRVKFVPSLLIVNREESDLPSLLDHLKRLMVCSRFYHPHWLALVSEAISSILFPTTAIVLFLESLLETQWETAALLFQSYSIYTIGLLLLMLIVEYGVQQVIRLNEQPMTELSATTIIKMLIGIPLTQWVYGLALVSSLWISTVTWRGVSYRVKGPWNIRLVEYRPYQWLDQPVDSKASL